MVKVKHVLSVLTVCIALVGYLPIQSYLDPFARWFFPAALVAGLLLEGKGASLSGRVLTPLSILLFLYFASRFSLNTLILVTADLLVVFLGVRMLGEKSGRNYLQVFALSLFCLAASSLYNFSALFLVYLLVLLLLLAVSLVVLTFHAHDPELVLGEKEAKKVLTVSCLMPAAALPILLVLFVVLPRTQYPLWDFLNHSEAKKVTGFSDTVKPGGSSSVSEVKTVVMRVICSKIPEQSLYWRGIVLNGFDGDAWIRVQAPPETRYAKPRTERIRQEIYPEPSQVPYLLALNVPYNITGLRYTESTDAVYRFPRTPDKRLRYEVESTLSGDIPVRGGIDNAFYLTLPKTVSQRLQEKGRELSAPGLSVKEKLKRVEQFFRSRRLYYATTGLPVGPDPVDEFLFVKRRGHCELFASSCATLLRLAGVPARLVGGYRGGTYSEMGGYYVVTEDMAHVWVEAYEEGRGWVSVDPSAWAIGFSGNANPAQSVRMLADALGFFWNKAVITYDLEKQIALVRTAGSKARNVRLGENWWKPVAGGCVLLALLGGVLWGYLKTPRSREERLLRRFRRVVARRYPEAFGDGEGLFDLAQKTGDPRVNEFADIFGGSVYGDRRLKREELEKLKEIIQLLDQHAA